MTRRPHRTRTRKARVIRTVCTVLAALALTLVPALTAQAAAAPLGPAAAAAVTNCQPQGSITLAGGEYTLQNNEWNSSAPQCVTATTGTAWSMTTANFNLTGGAPATYPSIYKGCHWGACTTGSNLPIQVSKLASATSSWSTVQPAAGAYDVAYDLWTNSAPTTGGQPDDSEIMIWLNSRGGVAPFGSKTATATIAGLSWDVYTGRQAAWNIVSYVLRGGGTAFSNLDVKSLINDSVSRGTTGANAYLIDAEAGFEIWQGGQGLGTNSFSFNATQGTGTSHVGRITGFGGKCVDVNAAGTANGTAVQLYDCNGTAAQQWVPGANNSLRNPGSGRCLDATGNSSANGTRLQIWDCGAGANQSWTLP